MSNDPTETRDRRELMGEINSVHAERTALEAQYGQVWDTQEVQRDFTVLGFLAPYIQVVRKSDGAKGSMTFQHNPRFYFSFKES